MYRLALDQIDDTCFKLGMTFYTLEDAIQGIKEGIDHGEIDFAKEVCNGLLVGLSEDWGHQKSAPSQVCEEAPY